MYQIITFSLLLRVHVNKADGIFFLIFFFLLQVHVRSHSNDRQCPPVCVWTKTRGQNRGRVGTAGQNLCNTCTGMYCIYFSMVVLIFQSQILTYQVSFKLFKEKNKK